MARHPLLFLMRDSCRRLSIPENLLNFAFVSEPLTCLSWKEMCRLFYTLSTYTCEFLMSATLCKPWSVSRTTGCVPHWLIIIILQIWVLEAKLFKVWQTRLTLGSFVTSGKRRWLWQPLRLPPCLQKPFLPWLVHTESPSLVLLEADPSWALCSLESAGNAEGGSQWIRNHSTTDVDFTGCCNLQEKSLKSRRKHAPWAEQNNIFVTSSALIFRVKHPG